MDIQTPQRGFVAFLILPIFPWLLVPFSITDYASEIVARSQEQEAIVAIATSTVVEVGDRQAVKEFVEEQAVVHGVNPSMAVFIGRYESNFREDVLTGKVDGDTHLTCPLTGEPQRARGLWQISSCWHPEVPDEVAYDVVSSTLWAMPHLLERPWIWSTYKMWLKVVSPHHEVTLLDS